MEAEPAVAAAEPSAEPEAAGVVLDVTADNSARLQELVRQAEEQAQQVRPPRACTPLRSAEPDAHARASWSWRGARALSWRMCCSE